MRRIGRLASVTAVLLSLSASAWAQIAPTPAGWEPEQTKVRTDAYVAEQVAVFTRRAPASEIEVALQRAQMVRPDEPTATNNLASYFGPGQSDDFYLDILAFRADEPVANYRLAEMLSIDGYVNLALPYFAKASSQRQNDLAVQYEAAMNAFYAEDDSACVAYFTRALAIGQGVDSQQVYLKRGECYARAGKKKEARADFEQLTGNGGAYSVRMFNEGVFDGCGWGWGSLDDRVRNAVAEADDWKTYEGYRELTRVLECDPKHIGALTERLKLENRDDNLARHARVHAIQLQNLKDGGTTFAARMSTLQPSTPAEMLAQGEAIDMQNDAGGEKRMRAAYLASRVLMLEPDNARAHLLRARAVANLSIDPLSALAWDDATRALSADPKLAVAHFVRGILLVRKNDPDAAVSELTAAIAIDPNDVRFYGQRGAIYLQMKRNEPAVQDLTRFLASNPKDIPTLLDRAQAYYSLKRYQAALTDLEAVRAITPTDFRTNASIVNVLDAMGRKPEADALHTQLLVDHEAESKTNTYLSTRATPDLSVNAARAKERQNLAALQKRAEERFQLFVNDYSPGEYSFDNLVLMMNAGERGEDVESYVERLRDTAAYSDEHLRDAWRIGSDLVNSDEAAALSEEKLGKLIGWLTRVQFMQENLKTIIDTLH